MSKKITRTEFDQSLSSGRLPLTLIGMSNTGKTHWSRLLARDYGFTLLVCDDLIEAPLRSVLSHQGIAPGIEGMAIWMGQPYEKQFAENQRTYLDFEAETMATIAHGLERDLYAGSVVVESSGSLVHLDQTIQKKLAALTTVVYIEASPKMQQRMFEMYIGNPKPVIWEDLYAPRANESPNQTLARCYPELLAYRSKLYAAMADVTIPLEVSLAMTETKQFLEYIKNALPA